LVPSNLTLREFLLHPDGFHLAMGPAFFGYFAYFGALITLDEAVGVLHYSHGHDNGEGETSDGDIMEEEKKMLLKSVAGASAGAMAAVPCANCKTMDRISTFNSSTRACEYRRRIVRCHAGTGRTGHPVRNLMRRATMARKFACFSRREGRVCVSHH
jgi:hypothetical protein